MASQYKVCKPSAVLNECKMNIPKKTFAY